MGPTKEKNRDVLRPFVVSKKGITLIALVITIIILLILAAVTLTLILNGGLIGQAQNAEFRTELGTVKETVGLKLMERYAITQDYKEDVRNITGKTGSTVVKTTQAINNLVYDIIDIDELNIQTKRGKTQGRNYSEITSKSEIRDVYLVIAKLENNKLQVIDVVYVDGEGRIWSTNGTYPEYIEDLDGRAMEPFRYWGVEDGKTYFNTVTPQFVTATATLNKNNTGANQYISGTGIEEEGTYILVMNPQDGQSQVTITFTIDKTVTIMLKGSNPATGLVTIGYEDEGATATNAAGEDVSSQIVVTGTVDNNTVGTYTLTYTVGSTSVTRTVNIVAYIEYAHTGYVQEFVVPITGAYTFELWGSSTR